MITIIDYGLGNLGSIANMLKKCCISSKISSELSEINAAERLILPGVGSFDNAMELLDKHSLLQTLHKKVIEQQTPILGICLGMQLMGQKSAEGNLPGLGWINSECIRFDFTNSQAQLKVPHMGWNTLDIQAQHPIFNDLYTNCRFYFAHSYYMRCHSESSILAISNYGSTFPCAVARGNIIGIQFHPEKSHRFGMQLLKNFSTWEPDFNV